MTRNAAFQFIPELIGDFAHTMELSGNPQQLYIEAAIRTLHMAANVFTAIEEHKNTQSKKAVQEVLQEKYNEAENARTANYAQEVAAKIDIEYEKVKADVRNNQFQDKVVRDFISSLKAELYKVIEIYKDMQASTDSSDRAKAEEITRKAMRNYNKLLKTFIEEEEENGKNNAG